MFTCCLQKYKFSLTLPNISPKKRLGTHSTHIPHFLHTHPLKHALLPNNNIYYFIIYIIIEVKVRGKGILGVCKIYVEYVYYVYFYLIFNATH